MNPVLAFHRSLPGYAPTPVVALPGLARSLGIAHLYAKDESNRLGLPAFKALGASWAVHRALAGRPPSTVVTATDGNHGRAVARFARLSGHRAAIYVPPGVPAAAIRAIEDEGAAVTRVPGDYDAAVRAAAHAAAAPDAVLVQDTAWPGYEEVPGWIVDGYGTLFAELDEQLPSPPDLVIVPAGVGSLLQAALTHYRGRPAPARTAVVSVEPRAAACVLASVAAGHPVTVATGETALAGLNCGTVSSLAWPHIAAGLSAGTAVDDPEAFAAARLLRANGVDAGPCGAAPLAALLRPDFPLPLSPATSALLLVTEGAAAV
ncbi:pyridoxal-phosphate dependent enzyme [Dactylosporangium sp. CA-139066]|uniref:pyridoxal-phosphate dependent enzyme n=1 Tax=Dactylosporangium sp. CA-139066 TaxID=3239930 RepID=UPI003D8CCA8B